MKIVKLILCVLFGLMFINAGLDKFLHYMPIPKMEGEVLAVGMAMASIKWLMPLVATIEILGGLLFAIPKTRALGAMVIFPIMVGIMLHHATYLPQGLPLAAPFFLINLWIIFDNCNKYKPMVS